MPADGIEENDDDDDDEAVHQEIESMHRIMDRMGHTLKVEAKKRASSIANQIDKCKQITKTLDNFGSPFCPITSRDRRSGKKNKKKGSRGCWRRRRRRRRSRKRNKGSRCCWRRRWRNRNRRSKCCWIHRRHYHPTHHFFSLDLNFFHLLGDLTTDSNSWSLVLGEHEQYSPQWGGP